MSTEQDLLLESLYRTYFDKLKILAYAQVNDGSVAEELVQETFLVALKDREEFCRHERPFAYLKKTLKNKVREYRREKNRYCKLFLSMDHELIARIGAPSSFPPVSASGILETARETLADDEWYILWQFSMKGAPHRQIAETMGISVPACHKRLERIRKKLEGVLPEY